MDKNEIIVVRQLPVIEEQLRSVKESIQARVDAVLAMECTEDTVKEIKKARAELNAERRDLEARRKEVKAKIEAPYKAFEVVYKSCAGDIYDDADRKLAEKIRAVENGLKDKKAVLVKSYFAEYRASLNLPEDLADYDRAGINVTLSASEKSMKAQAKAFLDQVSDDLKIMRRYPEYEEILYEYRRCWRAAEAVEIVYHRHQQIEEERKRREAEQEAIRKTEEHVEVVQQAIEDEEQFTIPAAMEAPADEFHAPIAEPFSEIKSDDEATTEPESIPERRYSVAFRVVGTIGQLKAMKKFLNDGGYEYEQLS